MDVPITQILKKAIRTSREYLISKEIIDEHSISDKTSYPSYDPKDPFKNTQRELAVTLLKQHEFLITRVVAQHELGLKCADSRFGADGKVKFLKAIMNQVSNAEQAKAIQELRRENSALQ